MELKELMTEIEKLIQIKIDNFNDLGKKAKSIHQEMKKIIKELEPIEFIVRQKYPNLCELFDNLKKESFE